MLSTMQDAPLSIATLLKHGSTLHGTSEVVTWTGSDTRRRSYAEVGDRAARLANALRGLGVTGDQRVGTFMWNNAEHLEAYMAIPAMGAVLHTLNIRLFPEQLVYVADHAEDHVIIVDGTLIPLLNKPLAEMTTVRHIVVANGDPETVEAPAGVQVHDYEQLLAAQPAEFDWPVIDERSAAAMCYTSGTTGEPKGVVYSHRSIWLHSMQVCMSDSMRLADTDKALVIVPQFHAMSWGVPYAAFMVGTSLVMPDRFLQPGPIAEILATEQPTYAAAVPTIWQGLLQHLEANPQDISHLREVVVGGSAAPPAMMHAFEEQYNVPVLHAWGMTETSPLGSVARPPRGASGDEAWHYRYTQGRFPASVQARLIDDDGNEVPWDGESVGELEVAGPWIAGAYHKGSDPEKFHDGWLRTGDVGKITPNGYLTLTDRSKDVIKSGGEWISSVDLENDVMAHEGVAEAAVVGVPDEKWDERPLVAVVVKEGHTVTAEELREFLRDKVAKWQLPEHWTFIPEVPKTSVGKFDKKRIRADHAEGKLDIRHF
ncbi:MULTISPECIES: long-chain fatty acid--CoA ligase [Prauserella salsuginis group]|uniref:Fatty-acyl-CoA synthase n=2 Tax=Prauserella salsuginis group TaxID=2893672 RepID=A0A839XJP4_9PSEU|nr:MULTISPECIES: long-chain fatty acid--CoA ligase [Prauserella salsuginis group]MBB3663520.1 fatty-acyl-CoA synthase [Prauserella sediminis]MCR3720661.1 fatty-acyl-CoA synthase [Prauserella flava]MCR3735258.1 fatty-acyl-CoA synthase [Prauserella salsuginis]